MPLRYVGLCLYKKLETPLLSDSEIVERCNRLLSGRFLTRRERVAILASLVEGTVDSTLANDVNFTLIYDLDEGQEPIILGGDRNADNSTNGMLNQVVDLILKPKTLTRPTATEVTMAKALKKQICPVESFTLTIGRAEPVEE